MNDLKLEEYDSDITLKEINDCNINNNIYTDDIVKQYLNEIKNHELPYDELRKLIIKYNNGETYLRNKIVESNLGLVVYIAKRYIGKAEFLDLIEEGNIGLIKAVEKFNIEKETKFSTYAAYWIEHYIRRYIYANYRSISLPEYLVVAFSKINLLRANYSIRNINITDEELAQETGYSIEIVKSSINYVPEILSLNGLFDDEEKKEYISNMPSKDSVENEVIKKELKNEILEELGLSLTPEVEHMIRSYYGLDTRQISYTEMGRIFGCSGENIRQKTEKAKRKLKYNENFHLCLKEYVEYE